MKFKFNTYNENYIMINRFDIYPALAHFDKENKSKEADEIFQTFINIDQSIINYEKKERKKGNFYPNILDIAIKKNSKVGAFILATQQNPEHITLEQITHSLLVCINREEWEYYDKLTKIIKKIKEEKCSIIDYNSIKFIIGSEITNYIINSQSYSTKAYSSDKTVYLYENGKITKTELPTDKVSKGKVRTKTK